MPHGSSTRTVSDMDPIVVAGSIMIAACLLAIVFIVVYQVKDNIEANERSRRLEALIAHNERNSHDS